MSVSQPTVILRNWDDFLKIQLPLEEKLDLAKSSNLVFTSPETKRNLVWCEVVPQEFAQEALDFYRLKKAIKQVSLSIATATCIREDLKKTYVGTLISLKSNQKFSQAAAILSIFALKRPDIGYHYGMNFIVAMMLHVFGGEGDAFVMFCHLIENVYPENFFTGNDRKLSMHIELRIFAMMAEKLRPGLVKTLIAIFRPKNETHNKRDLSPFHITMKRVAEVMYLTLFSTILLPQNLLRVWDVIFIYGFEYAHKIALTLLSKDERFFKNKVKAEVKSLGIGNSIDVLIAGGNFARAKFFLKIEKVPIEKLIKKALTKPKYKLLRYEDFLQTAEYTERDYMDRINRLRHSRAILLKDNLLKSIDETKYIFDTLRRFDHSGLLSRQMFMQTLTKEFNWSKATALNVFTTFDQKGNDTLDIREVLSGLCLLFNGSLDDRLGLLFKVFDINDSRYIEPDEAIDIISVLETSLDVRSNFFKIQSGDLFDKMDRNQDGKISQEEFVSSLKGDPTCKMIMDYLVALDTELDVALNLNFMNYSDQGSFLDIHSPLRRSTSASPSAVSEFSEPNEFEDLVNRDFLGSGTLNTEVIPVSYDINTDFKHKRNAEILELSEEVEQEILMGETPIAKFNIEETEKEGLEITTETINGNIIVHIKIGDLLDLGEDLIDIHTPLHDSLKEISSDFVDIRDYIDVENSLELIENYYQDEQMNVRATTPTEIRAIFDYEKVNVEGISSPDPAYLEVEQYFSRQSDKINPNSAQSAGQTDNFPNSFSSKSSKKSSPKAKSIFHQEDLIHTEHNKGFKLHENPTFNDHSLEFKHEEEALEKHLNQLRAIPVSTAPEDETDIALGAQVEISVTDKTDTNSRICSRMCARGGCAIF